MGDLTRTLFHPSDQGNISDWFTLRIWRVIRRLAPGFLLSAGPINFVGVILYWGLSVVVGFALLYAPFMPTQFLVSPGMDATRLAAHPFAYAGTLSLASLITVTLGLQTNSVALQYAMGIEAVLGFVILTASISWILSIYPVIEHRRSLAHEVTLLHFSEENKIRRLDQMSDTDLQTLLLALAEQVTTIRTELSQFPITYYFQERDERSILIPALQYLAELSRDTNQQRPGCRVGATVLGGSVDDLLHLIAKKYLRREFPDRWEALEALNRDHHRRPLHRPSPR